MSERPRIEQAGSAGDWMPSKMAESWETARGWAERTGLSYRLVDSTGLVIREYHPRRLRR